MRRGEAAEFDRERFPAGVDPGSVHAGISDELYVELLDALEEGVPYSSGRLQRSAPAFFFAGCLHFDRWTVPTPYIVSENSGTILERFITALERSEPGSAENSARFRADHAKSQIYSLLDWANVEKIHD